MKHISMHTAAVVLLSLMSISCSISPVAGNGSEITNGHCVVAKEGYSADSARVIAFPHGYDPVPDAENIVFPETTFTDTNGWFSFTLGDSAWNLLIYDRTGTYGAFVPLHGDSSLNRILLDSVGYVKGMFNSYTDVNYIGVTGSPFYADFTLNDSFTIAKLPTFNYEFSVWVWRYVQQCVFDSVSGRTHCSAGLESSDSAIGAISVRPGTGTIINVNP
jgi:hypothetical protein